MKVEIKSPPKIIHWQDMKVGQIGEGVSLNGDHNGDTILCIYGGFVSLRNPGNTWRVGGYPGSAMVELLPPGVEIKLTVEV